MIFYNETDLEQADERFKEMLEILDFDKYGKCYELTVPIEKDTICLTLEFHARDHFTVLDKYEIWGTMTGLIVDHDYILIDFVFLTDE
jgi:hypothetical protein